jgi:hypothetical protein
MRAVIKVAVCALALASGAAFADGVPIIIPAPALKAGDPALQLPRPPGFVKLHPVIFAGGSFGANVLTVTIEGKEYRFVGAMMPTVKAKASAPKQPKFASWNGKEPGGGTLGITKDLDTGNIDMIVQLPPSRILVLAKPGASTVLVESDRSAAWAPPVLIKPVASGVQK